MYRYVSIVLMAVALGGCATHAATSGRVVIQDGNNVVDVRITDRDRAAIENYYRRAGKKKGLPPGLAKRGGSLPPGLAKRDKLPPGLQGDPLPTELERGLTPLPASYVRVRIGSDIVLMDRNTRVVFDVVYGIAG